MKPTIEERLKAFKEANPDLSQGLYSIADLVNGAVMAKFDDPDSDSWVYVEEIYEDHVIIKKDGKYWRVDYSMTGGDVELADDMTEVDKKVSFEGNRGGGETKQLRENRAKGELFKESSFESKDLIIRNVSLLGAESANGYTYTEDALRDAARLLDGAVQYTNHSFNDAPRDVNESFSEVRNVKFDQGAQKVFGDMYLVNTPWIREELFPRIERFSHKFGNSIVCWGEFEERDGKEYVTKITAVESCDLVSDPATNKGLFESIKNKTSPGGEQDMKFTAKDVRENKEVFEELKQEILKEVKEGQSMEALRKENEFLKGENKKQAEKIDGFEREKAIEAKKVFIDKAIEEAKLPKIAVTAMWKKSLLDMDETDIRTAISELSEAVNTMTEKSYNFESHVRESGGSEPHLPTGDDIAQFARDVVRG